MSYDEKFERALPYAARLHRHQKRKESQTPYVTHLLAVAAIVGENGGTEDEVVAALLHDAIEDTEATEEDLAERFGREVADIVAVCSDADTQPKPPWRERKQQHLQHVRIAPVSVRLVVAADKLHNARTILADLRASGTVTWDRFNGVRDGTLWYYRAMTEALREAGSHPPVVEELGRVVNALERLG